MITIKTNHGDISVELFDEKAPISCDNFRQYAKDGHFDGTIFHRVIPNFMIQGGGFTEDMSQKSTRDPIRNEADNGEKNLRGTLAMARTQVVDSATSQFFINLRDNNFLDHGGRDFGYAVFGKVSDGMDVVDAIAALPVYNFGGVTAEIPLRNYTQADFDNNVPVDENNFVMINAIVVTDTTVDSAAGLNPPANTASGGGSTPNPPPTTLGGGGGSLGVFSVFGLLALAWRRKRA